VEINFISIKTLSGGKEEIVGSGGLLERSQEIGMPLGLLERNKKKKKNEEKHKPGGIKFGK